MLGGCAAGLEFVVIDFMSTDAHTDPQAARCGQLLAAVLAVAVQDLRHPFQSHELEKLCNHDPRASASLNFFFGAGRPHFVKYSNMIGVDPEIFLDALLRDPIVRARYELWTKQNAAELAAAKEKENA